LLEDFYFVKNLRGIVYFKGEVCCDNEIKWLKRHFKYRSLGIHKDLWKEDLNFVKLELRKYESKFKNLALKSLLLASYYLVPLIILKIQSLQDFEDFLVYEFKIKEKLEDREIKRNIRLVNYSITDYCLKKENHEDLIKSDLKRFWRLKESKDGKPFIAYLDATKANLKEEVFRNLVPAIILDLREFKAGS